LNAAAAAASSSSSWLCAVIRVGTCGSLQAGMKVGDVIISSGCIRDDGTSPAYVPLEFPALASPEVVTALQIAGSQVVVTPAAASASEGGSEGGSDTGTAGLAPRSPPTTPASGARPAIVEHDAVTARPVVTGVTHCKGSFYSEIPGYVPDAAGAEARWAAWVGAGAVATEMEGAALFIIGGARRMRVGMVLAVLGVTKSGPGGAPTSTADALGEILTLSDAGNTGKAKAIAMAVQALKNIIRHDIGAVDTDDDAAVCAKAAEAVHLPPVAKFREAERDSEPSAWSPARAFVAGALLGALVMAAAWRQARASS
jgi:uridine phosphorylase